MSRLRTSAIACALAATALAALTACGNDDPDPTPSTTAASSTPTSGTATSTASPNSAFDPCGALTPPFLAQHEWNARAPEPEQHNLEGFTWKGCLYLAKARYSFNVQTTNGTLDQIKQKFPSATTITISGRKALRYQARPDVPGGCTVNVEMRSGSLYILVDDPRGLHPRKLSPCDSATEIAEAVTPLLPAGA